MDVTLTPRARRVLRLASLAGLLALVAACVPVTVNIVFPQDKLEGAASRIEDMVRSPENPKPPAPPKKEPQSRLSQPLLAAAGPGEAAAENRTIVIAQEPRVDTPEIRRAVASRNARFGEMQQWKGRGCIGESNQGLVEARPGQGCGDLGRLIGAENADRQLIMDTFMRQNNIPASDAGRVRAAFAKTNRDRAQAGEWIQQDNGQWVKK